MIEPIARIDACDANTQNGNATRELRVPDDHGNDDGFGIEVAFKQHWIRMRAGGGNEPGRERSRARGRRVALDHDRINTGFLRGECGVEPGGAGADNQQRCVRVKRFALCRVDHRH